MVIRVESSINDNQCSSLLIKVHCYVQGAETQKGRNKSSWEQIVTRVEIRLDLASKIDALGI